MYGYHDMGWMMGGGMGLAWILILILAVALVIALVRQARSEPAAGTGGPRGESAEEILRQRFARGEIQRQEYEEKLAVLRGAH
jgi:putative membrane protein